MTDEVIGQNRCMLIGWLRAGDGVVQKNSYADY